MEQEQFVGFDVSQAETSVCVVDGVGKAVWQGKCPSTPPQLCGAERHMLRGSRSKLARCLPGIIAVWRLLVCPWSASTPGMPRQHWRCN